MSQAGRYRFRLYVAGGTQNSTQALINLKALCRAHLAGRHEVDVVDVLKEPRRAMADGVFMTPTLVVVAPAPVRRVVGNLSQTQTVLHVIGIAGVAV